MRAHLVFAHPNLASYNGALRNIAIQTLEASGWQVTVSDLYQMKFKAAADEDDFTALVDTDFFDLQKEQVYALQRQTFAKDIQREHQLLSEADLIIFQFPLWWHSVPGLLKGYIDRVFSMGWSYGGGRAMVNKKVLVSMTTGAPEFVWTPEKRGTIKDIFSHLFEGTFAHMGMFNLEPFIVYGAKRHTAADKESALQSFKMRLEEIVG